MSGSLRLAWLASVAASAMLLGHALCYLCEGRSMGGARHAYVMPALDLTLALALVCAMLLALRMLGERPSSSVLPPFPRLWLWLAGAQVGGFITMEALEGNHADLFGCAVEALVAMLAAQLLSFLCGLVVRCAEVVSAAYLRRRGYAGGRVLRHAVHSLSAAHRLAARAGVRRFKRPPPALA